jgi:hypothetical protein
MSWYNVKILNKEINWASVLASGVLFIGLEVWRRKYISEKIKEDIRLAMSKIENTQDGNQEETMSLMEKILSEIG